MGRFGLLLGLCFREEPGLVSGIFAAQLLWCKCGFRAEQTGGWFKAFSRTLFVAMSASVLIGTTEKGLRLAPVLLDC